MRAFASLAVLVALAVSAVACSSATPSTEKSATTPTRTIGGVLQVTPAPGDTSCSTAGPSPLDGEQVTVHAGDHVAATHLLPGDMSSDADGSVCRWPFRVKVPRADAYTVHVADVDFTVTDEQAASGGQLALELSFAMGRGWYAKDTTLTEN